MPQQRSRTRAVIPGKAILGVQGAAKAAASTIGGAVVPGRAVLGNLAEQENARFVEARKQKVEADAKQETGPKPKAEKKEESGLPPLRNPRAAAKAKEAPPPTLSLSEAEAVAMLTADPSSWEHVLDLESERADGMRPAIAAAILAVGPTFTDVAPAEAIAALQAIAGDSAPKAE